jgi:rsbT co-antagonist protein RsbR
VSSNHGLSAILKNQEASILSSWVDSQLSMSGRRDQLDAHALLEQSRSFLSGLSNAVQVGYDEHLSGSSWDEVRALLSILSKNRAIAGFSSSETATFVFSLKQPLFTALRTAYVDDPKALSEALWHVSTMLDTLGLVTIEAYQLGREQVIDRQHQELLDLSTPVIRLWDGIVAMPLIGTLDSERTQVVMESLLEAIVENEASIAIIDITGVPTVDTQVAQHLLKTVAAARLMGAECIISGIRPQIAQTIVHLGVELGDVTTKSSLADALRVALRKSNLTIVKLEPAGTAAI